MGGATAPHPPPGYASVCNYSLRSFLANAVSLQTVCLEDVAAEFVASALCTALYAYFSFSFSLYA